MCLVVAGAALVEVMELSSMAERASRLKVMQNGALVAILFPVRSGELEG